MSAGFSNSTSVAYSTTPGTLRGGGECEVLDGGGERVGGIDLAVNAGEDPLVEAGLLLRY